MQTSTRIACSCDIVKVRVVMSATPIVAVRPGRAPMTMPRKVAQTALKMDEGVSRPAKANPNSRRLSNINRLGAVCGLRESDEEELLEDERHQEPGEDTLEKCGRDPPGAHSRREFGPPL